MTVDPLDEVESLINDVIAEVSGETAQAYQEEWERCAGDVEYFILNYVHIYDSATKSWIRFALWAAQLEVLAKIDAQKLLVILKARQVGLTWLVLAYILWLMIFHPIQTILIFSKRDDEAVYLLGLERLRGMYQRLPDWMRKEQVAVDNDHTWQLASGSIVRAFPTTGGDSYTATFVLVDEADLVPNLKRLLASVKPTIDAGGKLVLLSRSDKDKPNSQFKKIYRQAKAGENDYCDIFLAWHVHPGRTKAWYDRERQASFNDTGSYDHIEGQYPATDSEALSASTLAKRIPKSWVERCYVEMPSIPIDELPNEIADIPGVMVWQLPVPGRQYRAGMDCAEGLITSDDSSTDIIDCETGEQVAHFHGKIVPEIHAAYTDRLAAFYNRAGILPENNNHGWAVILWLKDNGRCRVLKGHDNKDGWSSNTKGKALVYDKAAILAKEMGYIIHHFETLLQLESIEKSTLRAPEGEKDDMADSFVFAAYAMTMPVGRGVW